MADYDALIEEIEEQEQFRPTDFKKAMLNQPVLVSVSSVNGEFEAGNPTAYSDAGYYSFRVNLPRPILDVDALQLLSCNIPQANANIPDTACVFWYYRLSGYSGVVPNPNNLYMVRLLPSWYKREFIDVPADYGYNKTFRNYKEVAAQLLKSCTTDPAFKTYINQYEIDEENPQYYRIPFLPTDVSITYSTDINKFQFTGNPTTPVYNYFIVGNSYAIGDIIAKNIAGEQRVYQAIAVTSDPPPSVGWKRVFNSEAVAIYDYDTPYPAGRYVSYNNILYKSIAETIQFLPNATLPTWNSSQIYYRGAVVTNPINGLTYTSKALNQNSRPDISVSWTLLTWDGATAYAKGMIVKYTTNYYVASQFINSLTPPNVLAAWTLIGTSFWTATTLPDTSIGIPYAYNYLSTGYNDPNVLTAQSSGNQVWNSFNLYEADQVVQYQGRNWINTTQSQNEVPFNNTIADITSAVGTATFSSVGETTIQSGLATYQTPINYFSVGQVIVITDVTPASFNGTFRITSRTPTTFSVVNTAVGSGTGGIASYESYDDTRLYQQNDVVIYAEDYWRATAPSLNNTPNPIYSSWVKMNWEITADASPIVGLSQISRRFDFYALYTIAGEGQQLYSPFPREIPPQPYNSAPKRLLNTILGFTFNGQVNPALYSTINQPETLTTSSSNAPAYNRLRPVPLYVVGINPPTPPFPPPLALEDSLFSTTFTAEGYCNLVYSSIISIYTNIAGASTLDTQRDTNLLALVSMNVGNLGVSSWASFIDNPLTKVQGSIYSIYIELRDEYGEPYYLTNNAVSTFTFKIIYKD